MANSPSTRAMGLVLGLFLPSIYTDNYLNLLYILDILQTRTPTGIYRPTLGAQRGAVCPT